MFSFSLFYLLYLYVQMNQTIYTSYTYTVMHVNYFSNSKNYSMILFFQGKEVILHLCHALPHSPGVQI